MEFTLNIYELFFTPIISFVFLWCCFGIGYYLGLKKEEKKAIKKLQERKKSNTIIRKDTKNPNKSYTGVDLH